VATIGMVTMGYKAEAQIQFQKGTWADAVAAAKKQNKPIFVDAYATWCGPCKWMDANVFTDVTVGEYFNLNFINYKFDMEKGEGPAFAQKNGVKAYPTLLFFDKNEKEIHRVLGAKPADQFLEVGKEAKGKAK
jgi:thiol:disulfide interchange protein